MNSWALVDDRPATVMVTGAPVPGVPGGNVHVSELCVTFVTLVQNDEPTATLTGARLPPKLLPCRTITVPPVGGTIEGETE